MDYNKELKDKLAELKELYLEGGLNLDELVNFSARAGIESVEKIYKDLGGKYGSLEF